MRYESFDPQAELNGTSTQGFMRAVHLQADYYSEIITRHGLDRVDRDRWYQLQQILDVLNELNEVTDATDDFIQMGISVAELGLEQLPPEQRSIPLRDFLMNYTALYQARHHGNVGEVLIEEDGPSHYIVRAHTPYPDNILYGLMWGYVRNLKSAHTTFSLSFDPTTPRRDQGGDETVLHINITPK